MKSTVVLCFLHILQNTNYFVRVDQLHLLQSRGRIAGMCHFQILDIPRDPGLQGRTQSRSPLWVMGLPCWWSVVTRMLPGSLPGHSWPKQDPLGGR